MNEERKVEIWGGIEGTINRVGNRYLDQSTYSGHYTREGDVDLIASLGIKMLRYPVLWEKHQPQKGVAIDWSHAAKNLNRLKELQVEPIAGLVHHGSGPLYVNFFDGSFEQGLAEYASRVAKMFPWLTYYTPVNEPLTTARFCGLYGHWYPHLKDNLGFYKILLSECKATIMAMKAICEINPRARLIQTEDLSKTYSTPLLQYQADLENQRRWLSYDLLCGKVNEAHPLWNYLTGQVGLTAEEFRYFTTNPFPPHVCGFNYYLTSERYLDEDLSKYPVHHHGGNDTHRYADIDQVRVPYVADSGPAVLLREAYEHVGLPIAVTECHLHCTREEQLRWFSNMWCTVNRLKTEGVDIRALTAWSVLGAYGWDTLVTKPWGTYESGVFNIRAGRPRPTALARLIRELCINNSYGHPVLEAEGWWEREMRILYPATIVVGMAARPALPPVQPLLVIVESGLLGTALVPICAERNLRYVVVNINSLAEDAEPAMKMLICTYRPWAVVYAGAHSREFDTEKGERAGTSFSNSIALAKICRNHQIRFATIPSHFSDGRSPSRYRRIGGKPYHTNDDINFPAAQNILVANPDALVIRTGNLFGSGEHVDFVLSTLESLKQGKKVMAANDVPASITYAPDLIQQMLNLLLDDECGIFHLTNQGETTWAGVVSKIAEMAGFNPSMVSCKPIRHMPLQPEPAFHSNTHIEKIKLPVWQDALQRYFHASPNLYRTDAIAV